MENAIDYKDQLTFFFSKRGSDTDKLIIDQLDLMGDNDVKTLYDIVFAQNEKDRLANINVFYQRMEDKQQVSTNEMSDMKNKMTMVLEELQEIAEKSSNEDDFSKNITSF